MENCIAKLELIGQNKGEEPFQIVVEIGTPYEKNNDPEEWWCPVSVVPLFKNLHDAVGGGSFQSLCLGVALVLDLLQGFKEKGGVLRLKDGGEEVPLEAYAFGIAIKKP
jgi:hypothetical protein